MKPSWRWYLWLRRVEIQVSPQMKSILIAGAGLGKDTAGAPLDRGHKV